eukprot:7337396-Lingulodinium_polyedra.AAC.1
MLSPGRDEAAQLAHTAPGAIFCSSCRMWVNGTAQRVAHVAGKKHSRNADPALQPRSTDDQEFWARQSARSYLQLLYTRHT